MAILDLGVGGGQTTVDENTNEYDVLQINALNSHELIVDGVTTTASITAGADVAGSPIFTVRNGGDLTLDQGVLNASALTGNTFNIEDSSSMTLDGSDISALNGLNSFDVNFDNSGQGSFTYQEPSVGLLDSPTFNVSGMAAGDQLNLPGNDWQEEGYDPETQTLTLSDGDGGLGGVGQTHTTANIQMTPEQYQEYQNDPDSFFSSDGTFTMQCFAAGTMIATPDGEVAVETLSIGDQVLTADGQTVPVKWIGHQSPGKRVSGLNKLPVRISEGALGSGLPNRDLVVTEDHGMVIDGLVINAGALVNQDTIDYVPRHELPKDVTYYHIETEGHEVILANGAEAETYVDYLTRQSFDNYAEYVELYGIETRVVEMPHHRISSRRLLPMAVRERLGIQDMTQAAKTA
ncbi:Hint domain-containing protein [Halomonas caseinilytica]|uniref:Hint domain-containing protein n=1 Tax=Halomonas caseinilytica TaxID=438744 RepID=UPI0009F689E3|nr:Hint domain-containing protein [Halomonas caseinilytica]